MQGDANTHTQSTQQVKWTLKPEQVDEETKTLMIKSVDPKTGQFNRKKAEPNPMSVLTQVCDAHHMFGKR